MPGSIVDDDVELRSLRISDGPYIRGGLATLELHDPIGTGPLVHRPWISLWWWIKRTFIVSHCIVINGSRAGFIGLHNLRRDMSAEISMVLFEQGIRGKGYGSRAAGLFLRSLEDRLHLRKIFVRVRVDNRASLSLWHKFGFTPLGAIRDVRTMVKIPDRSERQSKIKGSLRNKRMNVCGEENAVEGHVKQRTTVQ
jgi:GNAT superfamily N-acetyltransferase